MKWTDLLCDRRYGTIDLEPVEIARTPFEKDIDRIVFSSAFRRLNHKTQVHPLPTNDRIHTRLSHSLEVASVGRSLGNNVGQKLAARFPDLKIDRHQIGSIVQAACLAHDIGNPPFGHSGEEAIRYWFTERHNKKWLRDLSPQEKNDAIYFEGNAQGLRIITQLEYHLFNGGMRLTYATLGAFLKYPWTSDAIDGNRYHKYGCNQSELEILETIATELKLIPIGHNQWCRHPLSYLMEAADDICYTIIDLEDGLEMGLINYDEFIKILTDYQIIDLEQLPPSYSDLDPIDSMRRKTAMARGRAIDKLIDRISNVFMEHHDRLLAGEFEYPDLIAACGGNIADYIQATKKLARDRIFRHHQKIELEVGAYATMDTLLDAFIKAAYHLYQSDRQGKQLSIKDRKVLQLMGGNQPQSGWTLYDSYLRIIDYISGMTDNYAAYLSDRLKGVSDRS
jgi:dGTPase